MSFSRLCGQCQRYDLHDWVKVKDGKRLYTPFHITREVRTQYERNANGCAFCAILYRTILNIQGKYELALRLAEDFYGPYPRATRKPGSRCNKLLVYAADKKHEAGGETLVELDVYAMEGEWESTST